MHYAYISNSMSSSSEEVVSFKVNLSGEARRFNLPKSEAGDLSLFKKKIGVAAIKLSWKDQDGDDVTVTSDEDLELALKEMEGPVFRFTASELDPKSDTKSKDAKVEKAKEAKESDEDGEEGEEEEDEPSMEEMFKELSSHGADYLRQLGGMITNALESLDALVVTDDEDDDKEKEEKNKKKEEEKEKEDKTTSEVKNV